LIVALKHGSTIPPLYRTTRELWKAILEHFKSEGRLTLEQRQELRGDLYETIKKRIADELDQRELPFAKQ
jgi:hypothetical protein